MIYKGGQRYKLVDPSVPVFVEYLESTGTQYMDPGIPNGVSGDLDEVSVDFSWVSFEGPGSSNNQPTVLVYTGIQLYKFTHNTNLSVWHNGKNCVLTNSVKLNKRYNVYISRQNGNPVQARLDGGPLLTTGSTPIGGSTSLFSYGRSIYTSLIKLYGCKFTRNGTVIRDLRPCLSRESGHISEPALYDVINKKYYYNKGTGTFLVGEKIRASKKPILFPPDLREWIQMEPGSIIKMNDVPVHTSLRNIRFKTKFRQYGNSSAYTTVIGNINTDQNVRMVRILTTNGGATGLYWYQYSTNTEYAGSSSIASDTDCVVELGPSIATQNGSNIGMNQSTLNKACDDKHYPFVIGSGNANCRTLRFYYVEIYEWDKLIRDLRPCLSTEPGHKGEPALYDMVTNKYYYNSGTGTFSVGNSI